MLASSLRTAARTARCGWILSAVLTPAVRGFSSSAARASYEDTINNIKVSE